ncbi:MAG: hypothetical protein JWQ38_2709 [Flavipsychrobacter sp.]|nr:hypothetical protein [Flavipsychrobacter sp.]
MVRRLGMFLFVLLCATRALAIDALVSHTLFYAPDPKHNNRLAPSVETYWQVNPRSVHYTTTAEKTIIARIRTDIYFFNEDGSVNEDHFILKTQPSKDMNELMSRKIIELRRYSVENGLVHMKFVLTDLADSTHPYIFRDSFSVNPPTSKPFYSDLQLLDTILLSDAASPFKKNNRQQIPSCMNFLDDSRSVLHYYGELYNTDNVSKINYPIIQKVSISKKENDRPENHFLKVDTLMGKPLTLVSGDFDISILPSGNYYLNVSLENGAHIVQSTSSLFFQRLNMHPAIVPEDTVRKKAAAADTGLENITVLNLEKTFVAKYNIPQTRAILKMLLPVSDPLGVQSINGFLKKPDDLYTRYFIYNYFQSVNKKDPAAAWKEYSVKIKEVNKLFTENGLQGYETDRGFIYLRYGKPTDIITVENEQGTQPYEIWQYNVLTQLDHKDVPDAVFLFYRPGQLLSPFKLLHSSVAGEQQNLAWRSYLYTSGQGGSNMNSRAEQYIRNK